MAIYMKPPGMQDSEDKLKTVLQKEADVHTKVGEFLFNTKLPPKEEPVTPVVHQPDLLFGGVFNTPQSRIGEVIEQKYPDVTPERIQEEQIKQPGAHLAGQLFREPVKFAADALSQIFRVSNLVGDKAIPGLMATIKGNIGKIADEATALIREFEYKTIPFMRKGEPMRILTEGQITEEAFKQWKPININNIGDRVWYHGTGQQLNKYIDDVGAPGGIIKSPTMADLDAIDRNRLDTGWLGGDGLYMTDEIGFAAYFALIRDIEQGVPRFIYSGVPKANLKVLDLTQPLKGNTKLMDTFLSATRFPKIQYTGLKKEFFDNEFYNIQMRMVEDNKLPSLEAFYRFLKKRERSLDNNQIAEGIPDIQPGVFMATLPKLLKKQGFGGMYHKESGHNVLLLWTEEGRTIGENMAAVGKQLGVMRPISVLKQNFSRKFIQDKDFSKNFGAYVRDPRNGLEDKFYRFRSYGQIKTATPEHPSQGVGTIAREVLGENPARTLENFKKLLITEELHYRYPKAALETKDKIRLVDKILGKNSSTEKAGLMSRLHKTDALNDFGVTEAKTHLKKLEQAGIKKSLTPGDKFSNKKLAEKLQHELDIKTMIGKTKGLSKEQKIKLISESIPNKFK